MKQNHIIILPSYNEELNIGNMLENLRKEFSNFFILVIDDSSNDLTKKEFEKYKNDNCEIISRNKKLGRGSAIRLGFEYAIKNDYSIIIEMDSDLSHDPKDLHNMINKFKNEDFDIIIGSRYLKESKIINWGIKRIIFSKLGNFLARFLFKYSIKDYTNGFRVYKNKVIKKVIQSKQINFGFIYLTEILIIAIKNGFSISEVPITFVNRIKGKSSVNLKSIIESFLGVLILKIKNF